MRSKPKCVGPSGAGTTDCFEFRSSFTYIVLNLDFLHHLPNEWLTQFQLPSCDWLHRARAPLPIPCLAAILVT